MPINNIVSTPHKTVRCQEGSPADGTASVKCSTKIVFLIFGGVHDRIVDGRSLNGEPSGQILIFLPQRLILRKNAVLRGWILFPRLHQCLFRPVDLLC